MAEPKKYSKLDVTLNYDKEVVEELAEAYNEIALLETRIRELRDIVSEHHDKEKFLWRTAENEVKAIHKITDDHLKNILNHQMINGRRISKELKAEARSRGIPIPSEWGYKNESFRTATPFGLVEGQIVDREDDLY